MSLNKYLTDLDSCVSMPHGATHVPYSPGLPLVMGYEEGDRVRCSVEWRKLVGDSAYYWDARGRWLRYSIALGGVLTPIPLEFIMDKFMGEL